MTTETEKNTKYDKNVWKGKANLYDVYVTWDELFPNKTKKGKLISDSIFVSIVFFATIISAIWSAWWYFVKGAAYCTGITCGIYLSVTTILPWFGIDFVPVINQLLTLL